MLLFNRPLRDILARFSRQPKGCDTDKSNHSGLMTRQPEVHKDVDTCKSIPFLPTDSTDCCFIPC